MTPAVQFNPRAMERRESNRRARDGHRRGGSNNPLDLRLEAAVAWATPPPAWPRRGKKRSRRGGVQEVQRSAVQAGQNPGGCRRP